MDGESESGQESSISCGEVFYLRMTCHKNSATVDGSFGDVDIKAFQVTFFNGEPSSLVRTDSLGDGELRCIEGHITIRAKPVGVTFAGSSFTGAMQTGGRVADQSTIGGVGRRLTPTGSEDEKGKKNGKKRCFHGKLLFRTVEKRLKNCSLKHAPQKKAHDQSEQSRRPYY